MNRTDRFTGSSYSWFQQGWVMSTGIVLLETLWRLHLGGSLRASPRLAPPRSEESLLELQTDSKPMTERCQRTWSGGIKPPWLCVWVKLRQLAQETPRFPASTVARCTFYCLPFNWCNYRPALPRGLLNSPVVVCKYHLSLALALELGDVFGMITSFSTELRLAVHLTYSGLWH